MANIDIRKENGNKPAPIATRDARWNPTQMAREFFGWDPFGEMAPFGPTAAAVFSPSFEVKESRDAYHFRADVPGVKESDLEITVTGNRLAISGKREAEKQEKTDAYYMCERSYGDFRRSFTLPDGVDLKNVHAELESGVLQITIPKLPEAQPKRVALKSAAKHS